MTKNILVEVLSYIGVAAVTALLYYFFFHAPDVKKAYADGKASVKPIEIHIPGKDSIVYRDTTIYVEKPAEVKEDSSVVTIATSFDSSFVSGKDTINIQATVVAEVTRDSSYNIFDDVVAKWFVKIMHADNIVTPDTVKLTYPVEVPVDVDWYRTDTFAYIVSGIVYLITVIGFIL